MLPYIVCTCADCAMWLKDDNVYEGVERLYLELDYTPLDPRVQIIPSRQRATIYIHDDNDGISMPFICAMRHTYNVHNVKSIRKTKVPCLLRCPCTLISMYACPIPCVHVSPQNQKCGFRL